MKICVGLSGGVDSSVAAYLLKKAGYDVFALFMQNWHDTTGTLHGDCEWEEDRFVAEMVARKIGIPFYFVDLSEEYRKRVVDYMFDEYSKGRTPNPDVLCNREIKFDAFLKCAMKLGADCVATGHYCRKDVITGADGEPVHRIFAGSDPNKDQSYFLCQLTQEQLSRAMFPVGDLDKPEVRRIAREADLPSADKKDSQGICFVGKVDLPTFLQQKLSPAEGNIVEVYDAYFQDNAQYGFIHDTLLSLKKDRESGDVRMITDYISETRSLKVNDPAHEYDAAGNPANEGGCSADSPFSSERIGSLTDEDLLRLSCPVTYDGIRFETETYRSGKKHIKKTRYKEICGNAKLDHTLSSEYGSGIMNAIVTNAPYQIGGNVMNHGLIPNLPHDCVVEVPCLVDSNGVQGTYVGDLPQVCAALNRTNINVQLLTIEAALTLKKECIYQAAMLDPHCQSELSIESSRASRSISEISAIEQR